MGLQEFDSVESASWALRAFLYADWALVVKTRQPILADEVQTFKALITVHKVLQEGHPVAIREAQDHTNWLESLIRGVSGDGLRGTTHEELRENVLNFSAIGEKAGGEIEQTNSHDRLRSSATRVCLLSFGKARLSQAASRIQRYV